MKSKSTRFAQLALTATLAGAGAFCVGVFQQAAVPDTALASTSGAGAAKSNAYVALGLEKSSSNEISKGRAKQIALDHAGYEKKKVKNLTAKYGHRGRNKAVIVKFRYRKIRYNYAINRETGKILSYVARLAA